MSSDSGARPGLPSRQPLLALVCVLVWITAAASTGSLGIWLSVGGAATVLGGAILLLDRAAARSLLRPSAGLVLIGAIVGGVMTAATYLFYAPLSHLVPFIVGDTARLYAEFRVASLWVAALALLPVILGEELVWRGVVQTALVRRFGAAGGVALAACVYGCAHAPLGSPVLVVAALACGLCWGALRAVTSSLVPALVAHLLWDLVVLLWVPLASR